MTTETEWWWLIPGISGLGQPVSRHIADRAAAAICAARLIPVGIGGQSRYEQTPTGQLAAHLQHWLAAEKDDDAAHLRRITLVMVCDSLRPGVQPSTGGDLHRAITARAASMCTWISSS